LLYGCSNMIKFENKKVYRYNLDKILKNLELSQDQFIKMCILFGCDFFYGLYKLDNNDIYQKIKENETIEHILNNYSIDYYEKNLSQFNDAYELYTSPYMYDNEILFSNNIYNFKKLLKKLYYLDKTLINNKFNIYSKLKKIST